jgi:hypothetical protein
LADLKWGVPIFHRKAPGKIEILAIRSLAGFTEKPIDSDQIPVRGLTGGEGKVGEKVQELTAVTRAPDVEEERG